MYFIGRINFCVNKKRFWSSLRLSISTRALLVQGSPGPVGSGHLAGDSASSALGPGVVAGHSLAPSLVRMGEGSLRVISQVPFAGESEDAHGIQRGFEVYSLCTPVLSTACMCRVHQYRGNQQGLWSWSILSGLRAVGLDPSGTMAGGPSTTKGPGTCLGADTQEQFRTSGGCFALFAPFGRCSPFPRTSSAI